jgi:hypothetical protein
MPSTRIKTLSKVSSYNVDVISANNVTVTGTSVVAGGLRTTPAVLLVKVTSNNYTILDDTSVNTSGGFIQVSGLNFNANCTLMIGSNTAISSTFVNTSTIRAQVPAAAAGSYHIWIVDSATGDTALKPNGLTHSSFPAWGTANSLFVTPTTATTNTSFNTLLSANSDSNIVYSNTSVLPPGSALLANGYFYGNVSVNETTTYSFTAEATDAEFQNTPKIFSIQIIKPSAIFYSYQFSGTNSFIINPPDPHQTTITGALLWNAYQKGWTWETWIKPTAGNSTRRLLFQYYYGNYSDSQHRIFLENTNEIAVFTGEQGYYLYDKGAGAYTIPLNSWTHVALVKQWPSPTNSGYPRISLYINGVKKRETYDHVWNNSDYGMTYQPYSRYDIGQDWGYSAGGQIDNYANSPFTGLISNMRITRNLAVYTGDFTVPTSPLGLTQSASTNIAAITGDNDTGRVILLTCNDSTLKDNGYYDRTASMISKNGGPAFVAESPFG